MKIAPSILSADFANLGKDIENIDIFGADLIHIDVMDGMFVPNISFGCPIIKSIRKYTSLTFDVHLMIENPGRYIDDFVDAGADIISVHYEADRHIDRTINYIKSKGVKAAIAINPGTPISLLVDLIPIVDMILIMSVNPGYGGQSYIEYCTTKISQLREIANKVNSELLIEVDGGVSCDNVKKIIDAGADIVVAGSSVFKNNDIENNIKLLRRALL